MRIRTLACLLILLQGPALAPAAEPSSLEPGQTIALPGVEGRFDHFSMDVKYKRLFVAALGNNSIDSASFKEPRAWLRKFKKSRLVARPEPSAMLADTDTPARRSCAVSPNRSPRGNPALIR